MADPEVRDHPPVPISAHSRVLIAMHKAMRADSQRLIRAEASLRATAPRLLGVIQDRVWEPRFARLVAPLYQQS